MFDFPCAACIPKYKKSRFLSIPLLSILTKEFINCIVRLMTPQDFVDFKLKRKIRQMGSIKAVAEWIGCTDVYLHYILRGREPGKKVLDAFGLERIHVIRKKR